MRDNIITGALNNCKRARSIIDSVFDQNSFVETDTFVKANGKYIGLVTGFGEINGRKAFIFAQDSSDGSSVMNKAQADKIVRIYKLAAKTGAPVIGVFDSSGADISDGNEALAAYGDILYFANRVSGVIPIISIILGNCVGCSAMIAACSDIIVVSKSATFYMPSSNISNIDDSYRSAELCGVSHLTAENDNDAVLKAKTVISMLPQNNIAAPVIYDNYTPADKTVLSAISYNSDYTYSINNIISEIFDFESILSFQDEFAKSAYIGFARLAGKPVGFIATDASQNDGKIDKDACSKISRMVRLCDVFSIPVISFIDTIGFDGQSYEIVRESAKLANSYAETTSPKLCVIMNKAFGAAYVAMAGTNSNSDYTIAWEGAKISPIDPVAAVEILFDERIKAGEDRNNLLSEYYKNNASPIKSAEGGYITDVISPIDTREKLNAALEMLSSKRETNLPKKHSNMPL